MKRLTYNNIKHITLHAYNSCIYEVFVSLGYVSDARCYNAGIEKVGNSYHPHPIAISKLPKCVIDFIATHERNDITREEDLIEGFTVIKYSKDRPKITIR